jgi:outer membrane immunogenic protein
VKRALAIISALMFAAPAAQAADMALKAPPPPAPVCVWCGWYVGVNAGYGWGESTDPQLSVVNPGGVGGIGRFLTTGIPGFASGNLFPNLKPSGALGGIQVGYDQQFNFWVLGAVADIQAADWRASQKITTPAATTGANVDETLGANVHWFGTVRARVGVATATNFLIYGTGGLAYGRVGESIAFACTPGGVACGGVNFIGSNATTKAGWTAGAGVEVKVAPHVGIGLEYLHVDLGRSSVTAFDQTGNFPTTTITESQRLANDLLRAVLNYRF